MSRQKILFCSLESELFFYNFRRSFHFSDFVITEAPIIHPVFDHLRQPVSPAYKVSSELMNSIEEETQTERKRIEFRLVSLFLMFS